MWLSSADMAEDNGGRSPDRAVEAADARTARTFVRWDAARRIAPWFFGSAAAVGVAAVLAGEATGVDIRVNVVLSAALTLAVPAAVAKIFWDKRQKRRLRDRVTELEDANRTLEREAGMLSGQITELRRELSENRERTEKGAG
jgi:hypothetical protein